LARVTQGQDCERNLLSGACRLFNSFLRCGDYPFREVAIFSQELKVNLKLLLDVSKTFTSSCKENFAAAGGAGVIWPRIEISIARHLLTLLRIAAFINVWMKARNASRRAVCCTSGVHLYHITQIISLQLPYLGSVTNNMRQETSTFIKRNAWEYIRLRLFFDIRKLQRSCQLNTNKLHPTVTTSLIG